MAHDATPPRDDDYDLVVLGAGAAGMTAALVGAIEGLRVLLIEKSAQIGGTSARAAGTLWIPGNFSFPADQAETDKDAARMYLDAVVGERSQTTMREAMLQHGPPMLDYLRQRAAIGFKPCPRHADYLPEFPGARSGGRPVEPEIFDGRLLGKNFGLLRAPIKEFMVFGGMMVSKADIDLLLTAGRSGTGSAHALRLGARYLRDRVSYARGTRLTMGNALCASLLHACLTNGVALRTSTNVSVIQSAAQHRYQLKLQRTNDAGAADTQLTTTPAIVFAGGGFSGSHAARQQHLPTPTPQHSAGFEGADGSSQQHALALGGKLGPSWEHNAWWFPSSIVPRRDGSYGVFPHIVLDRAKPGLIAVNKDGRRFVNEGLDYHLFSRAQYASGAIPCWLVCDARFIRRYGLGAVRPGGAGLARALNTGYIKSAADLSTLARAIGVDPEGLLDSAQRMTRYSISGTDEDFGKGSDPISRQNGDANVGLANPGLGPVQSAPFYALPVAPAVFGTSRGLQTDTYARLLDEKDNPLPGLYACGNDMQSVMGGQYPAPGITLGPAMTFAYLAAMDVARSRLNS